MGSRGEFVAAADFGSREVRILIARRDSEGAIQVVGHGTAPARGCVSQGVVQDLAAAQIAFHSAMSAAEREARVTMSSVFCGINGRNVETFIREGSAKLEHEIVEHVHMKQALDQASCDIAAPGKHITSSITSREWYVDDMRVIDPIDIRGQVLKVRVHFARLPAVIADNLTSCIESQRRDLEDMVFLPIASALGCLTPEDTELGVAVLDMGHSTTGLAVYRDHRILGTHCFEWGGNHITRDVAAGLQVSFEEAEELVAQYGIAEERVRAEAREDVNVEDAFPKKGQNARIKLRYAVRGAPPVIERAQLDEIVFERAKELLAKVRQHLRARGLIDHLARGVVLTGGVSRLANYPALAEAIFQTSCRAAQPGSVEILPHAAAAPEFSAAVGIVRHAFAYRTALHAGRIEGRGPAASRTRRLMHAFRKYFF